MTTDYIHDATEHSKPTLPVPHKAFFLTEEEASGAGLDRYVGVLTLAIRLGSGWLVVKSPIIGMGSG